MIIIDLKSYPFLCQFSGKTLEGDTHVPRTTDFLADYGLHAVADFSPVRSQIPRRFQYKKKFSCLDQFLCMAFAQLTYHESFRDIEVCLRSQSKKLYHMGIRGNVARSTLAEANENRDWHIYSELEQNIIATARKLYSTETFVGDLSETVYALDSTTIDLCLSVFPWASFRKTKSAIKLHTLLDLRGNIPTFMHISDGKLHDVNVLDILPLEAGAFYIMDRGYLDFKRLFAFNKTTTFFVTRAKTNTKFRRLYSQPVDKSTGLICDQTIVLTGVKSKKEYPEKLRHICERGKISDMDCRLRLCACGDFEKEITPPRKPLHNSTDFKCDHIRKRLDL